MRTAAALALVLASAVAVAAQSPAQRERERREREDREREAEFDLLMTDELRRPAPERRQPRPDLTKIREDYVQLQVTNNDLAARAASSGDSLDLKAVSSAAAEIRKRAERLKENLALPEPEREEARPSEPEGLKPTLAALDELILRFVRSPVFTSPKRVDLRHSAEAARDLERIIGLSGRVRKMCEKSRAAADAQKQE